ncbi:translation release factor [Lentinula raphanica]|uniref:Translation release factor n=1 Tax=Lentinula raphanica TaxID=153919 RepID=A0AA38U8T9_9AGAR|nr:translation release factor [Lentinula raphanica]
MPDHIDSQGVIAINAYKSLLHQIPSTISVFISSTTLKEDDLVVHYAFSTDLGGRVQFLSRMVLVSSMHTYDDGIQIQFVDSGTILTDEGKEQKVSFDFEPHKPINTSLYLCDNKFHTEALSELLESDSRFGFIVVDGNGTLFVTHKFTVDLPKKYGRGGQTALRFSRLRDGKRHSYVRKVAELAVQHFFTNDKVNLSQSVMFDPRLSAKVIKVVDVSYGGENGFNQGCDNDAIELAAASVKFVQGKPPIQKYFDEISQDTGKYCFGIDDTLKALELGAVETLIVWENLDITRYTLRNAAGGRSQTGLEMEQADEPQSLLEWFAEKYKDFGANLE